MKKVILSILLSFLLLCTSAISQEVELNNWKAYASLLNFNDTEIDGSGNIWGVSSGGAFKYNLNTGASENINNIDALLSLEINTLEWNSEYNEMYFGAQDGVLDILDAEGNWHHITDINTSPFPSKEINDIAFDGDKAYIVGGFGLLVFDVKNRISIENVPRFGRFNTSVNVKTIHIDENKIWIATSLGLAYAEKSESLSNPSQWETFDLKSNDIALEDMVFVDGTIFVRTESDIYEAELPKEDSLNLVKLTTVEALSGITIYDNKLVYSHYSTIYDLDKNEVFRESGLNIIGIKGVGDKLLVNARDKGLIIIDKSDSSGRSIIPNTPASNGFNDISISNDGDVWIAADHYGEGIGRGIMNFDGSTWTNYTYPEYKAIGNNAYYWINAVENDKILASNFGNGFSMIDIGDTLNVEIFNANNSIFEGAEGGSFTVAGQSRVDRNGNIWVVNHSVTSSIGNVLIVFTKDNVPYAYENKERPSNKAFNPLAIDFNGTKWLGGYRNIGQGVMYFNENNSFADKSDDVNGMISRSSHDALAANDVTSIEVDKLGLVWIGTLEGLSVILNPGAVFGNSNLVVRKINILGDIKVNDIMIDALNNKWIATENGVWILNADATQLLGRLDNTNTPIPTNSILSLATNENTGEIYFGTGKGLYSVKSQYVKPLAEYDLKCFPQPFDPDKDERMIIQGLAPGSELRILTTSGELIRHLSTQSRETVWDGRNQAGELVKSGIYLVVAASSTTEASSVQKIAVIKK